MAYWTHNSPDIFRFSSEALLFVNSFSFVPAFPLGRAVGAAALRGQEIFHGFQQSQIVLLAPHQDRSKPASGRCNHATCPWSTSGPCSHVCSQHRTCLLNLSCGSLVTWLWNNAVEISPFGEVTRHSRFCEFLTVAPFVAKCHVVNSSQIALSLTFRISCLTHVYCSKCYFRVK